MDRRIFLASLGFISASSLVLPYEPKLIYSFGEYVGKPYEARQVQIFTGGDWVFQIGDIVESQEGSHRFRLMSRDHGICCWEMEAVTTTSSDGLCGVPLSSSS